MSTLPFIVCENLVKIYKVDNLEVFALQGLDLTVVKGEKLGVIGPSGSGKSSLMNILGGLDRPSAGKIQVGDQDLLISSSADLNHYRRTQVGFVWQQSARNLVPYLNAYENVILPMTLAGVQGQQKRAWANELLDLVGMAERKHHRLSQLSGGEQQRVAISVSLANRPGLLLADEPTGEVDEDTALQIYDLFRQFNRQLGITILIVSHDPGIAQHVDRVAAIRDGKLATETVRRVGSKRAESHEQRVGADIDSEFEELSVLDSAGRVQLPKDYLDRLAINKRVRLELLEEGILIRPVTDMPEELTGQSTVGTNPTRESTETENRPTGLVSRILSKLQTRRKEPIEPAESGNNDALQEKE